MWGDPGSPLYELMVNEGSAGTFNSLSREQLSGIVKGYL